MKVMTIFGTRPEAIEIVPAIKALRAGVRLQQRHRSRHGQHREMLVHSDTNKTLAA